MIAETLLSALSVAGLGIAAITAYRRRFLTAARIAAYALVPLGLVLTGVVEWAVDTAFSPSAWVGFGLLGGAWLLFMTTRAVERRSGGRKRRKAAGTAQPDALAPSASAPAPSIGRGSRSSGQRERPAAQPKSGGAGDDFSDIEAILKKHGI